MAALTPASSERDRVTGDIRLRIYRFAAVANGDTFAVPGATRVLGAFNLSVGAGQVTWSLAGTTLTANVSAGNPAVSVAVVIG
jgi:hypothetical protein